MYPEREPEREIEIHLGFDVDKWMRFIVWMTCVCEWIIQTKPSINWYNKINSTFSLSFLLLFLLLRLFARLVCRLRWSSCFALLWYMYIYMHFLIYKTMNKYICLETRLKIHSTIYVSFLQHSSAKLYFSIPHIILLYRCLCIHFVSVEIVRFHPNDDCVFMLYNRLVLLRVFVCFDTYVSLCISWFSSTMYPQYVYTLLCFIVEIYV